MVLAACESLQCEKLSEIEVSLLALGDTAWLLEAQSELGDGLLSLIGSWMLENGCQRGGRLGGAESGKASEEH